MGTARAVVGLVVTGVLAAGLSGCGGEEPSAATPPTRTTPTQSPSTSASPTSPATTTAPTPTTGPLPALLLDLAEATRAVRDRTTISTAQGAVQDAVTATRTGLRATREAAFGVATRSCTTVADQARSTRGSADVAIAAADALDPMLDTRQKALDHLAAVIAQVEAEAAARAATATSPTAAELTAALDVSRTEHTTGAESLVGSRADATDGRAKAGELAAQAQEIYASTC